MKDSATRGDRSLSDVAKKYANEHNSTYPVIIEESGETGAGKAISDQILLIA